MIPSFRRGSGGHNTTVRLLLGLRELGHTVSVWVEDNEGRHARESAALTQRSFAEFFDAGALEVHADLREWIGADVTLATGWQTVARTLLLPSCAARAYLVQDHEPDFYPASAEALWAQASYRQGLHCVAASPWLAELLRSRYRASAGHLDLAVDHDLYRPAGERRADLVAFYARAVTPRRAVPLGLLALRELFERRPEARSSCTAKTARSTCTSRTATQASSTVRDSRRSTAKQPSAWCCRSRTRRSWAWR